VHLHRVELNETYGEVSDKACLWSEEEFFRRLCFSTVLQFFDLRVVQENQKAFHLKRTHQLVIHAEKTNLWDEVLNPLNTELNPICQ